MESKHNPESDRGVSREEKHLDKHHVTEEITGDARQAITKEHELSLGQGLKAYRKAIMWSILLSSAVIMEGYDTILVCIHPYSNTTDARLDLTLVSSPST